MNSVINDYSVWSEIDYQPAVPALSIEKLLEFVEPGMSALEIGCNKGAISLKLARRGLVVNGIDINAQAINDAKQLALKDGLASLAHFHVADVLEEPIREQYDLVVVNRVLTCFPNAEHWSKLLDQIHSLVRPLGLIYVNDFVCSPASVGYRERYKIGRKLGWRLGSFPVLNDRGGVQFVAHHHSPSEIERLVSPYRRISFNFYDSLSMNGNSCKMFEFLGQKSQNSKSS